MAEHTETNSTDRTAKELCALRIPKAQMARIEKFRSSLMIKPSLSETIRFLIGEGLDRISADGWSLSDAD
jgi:hypothetical protein